MNRTAWCDNRRVQVVVRRARPDDQPVITAMVRRARLNPAGLHWEQFVVGDVTAARSASPGHAAILVLAAACGMNGREAFPRKRDGHEVRGHSELGWLPVRDG
jgi:hypothetical protein